MKKKLTLLLALSLLIIIYSPAMAQETKNPLDKTGGLFLSVHGMVNQFDPKIGPNAFGGGGGLKLGTGFKRFNIYLGIDFGALNKNYSFLSYLELGGQLNFPVRKTNLLPYTEAGFSLQFSEFEPNMRENSLFGAGFFLGGGIKYFISNKIAFVTGLKFSYADSFEDDPSSESFDGQFLSTRLTAGLSWYPFN